MCESLVIAFRLICMVLHVCVCVFTRQGIYVCDKHTLPCEFYVNISEIFFFFFFCFLNYGESACCKRRHVHRFSLVFIKVAMLKKLIEIIY